jgi:mycothiol synthase
MARTQTLTGPAALARLVAFQSACRAADPLGGLWDAADVQWWFRDEAPEQLSDWVVCVDDAGRDLGWTSVSAADRHLDWDVRPDASGGAEAVAMLRAGIERLRALGPSAEPFRVDVREDDSTGAQVLRDLGFHPTGRELVQTVLALDRPPDAAPLPGAFRVRSLSGREEVAARVALHHAVFPAEPLTADEYERIRAAPQYREDLDLVAVAGDGSLAGFATVWMDDASGVAVFEPVGVHPAHRRRGLGRALLAEGLRRVCARGARVAKVSYASANEASRDLYRAVGFHTAFRRIEYALPGAGPMSRITFRDWVLDVDAGATRAAYARTRNGGAEDCGCDPCRNFVRARDGLVPGEVRRLFDALGVDPRKESECCWTHRTDDGLHHYLGWLHFVGGVVRGALAGERAAITPAYAIGFDDAATSPRLEALRGLRAVEIDFEARAAWACDRTEPLE